MPAKESGLKIDRPKDAHDLLKKRRSDEAQAGVVSSREGGGHGHSPKADPVSLRHKSTPSS
jgi:hypothetical protein